MGILDELMRRKKGEEEEEEGEEGEEGQQDENQVKAQQQQQQQQQTAQQQPQQQVNNTSNLNFSANVDFQEYIRRGEIEFLVRYPQLREELDTIKVVALRLLDTDLKTENRPKYLTFYDYMEEALKIMRENLISKARKFRSIPVADRKEEKVMTIQEYIDSYPALLAEKVKRVGTFVEKQEIDETGRKQSIYFEGQRKE